MAEFQGGTLCLGWWWGGDGRGGGVFDCLFRAGISEGVGGRRGGRGSNLVLEKFHVSPFLSFVSVVVVLSAIGGVIGASYAGV